MRTALGLLYLEQNRHSLAMEQLAEADRILDEAGQNLARSYVLITLGIAEFCRGRIGEGQTYVAQAVQQTQGLESAALEGLSRCVEVVGNVLADRPEEARGSLEAAQEILTDSGWGEGESLLAVAEAAVEAIGGGEFPAGLEIGHHARSRLLLRVAAGDGQLDSSEVSSVGSLPRVSGLRPDELVLHPDGRWFQLGGQQRVDLTRKRTLRPLLLLLARLRLEQPGAAVDVDGVFEGVWPGERILEEAKKNRVYVAVATLRKAGLEAVLDTRGDGYLIRPAIQVRWSEEGLSVE